MDFTHNGLIKVAIVGPESTGKSAMAKQLAAHYQSIYVKEMARPYLEKLNRPYTFEDVETIAKIQLQEEDAITEQVEKLLICDTNLLVIKVWMEFAGWKCPDWIKSEIQSRIYDVHLLMDIDLPWQEDPLREHPNERHKLMDIYINELDHLDVPYAVIGGAGKEREQNAIEVVDSLIC